MARIALVQSWRDCSLAGAVKAGASVVVVRRRSRSTARIAGIVLSASSLARQLR
jgi:hypothetical protein